MMKKIVTFGEAMIRLVPPDFQRIEQANSLSISVGGSELNVAADLARLNLKTQWISVLPDNPPGYFVRNKAREQGVDVSEIKYADNSRMGIYYVEYGSSPRSSNVVYDRAHSAICEMNAEFDWDNLFNEAEWFHTSGITPALSAKCADEVEKAVKTAKKFGCTVSYDLNYRAKLWSPEEAKKKTAGFIDSIDVCIGNEEDFQKVLGITAGIQKADFEKINTDYYAKLAEEVQRTFGFKAVGISLRQSHSVLRNGWQGLLYTPGGAVLSNSYELELIDRVGGGDSFSAGLIYGLYQGHDPETTINFATAFSALKHTIRGDFNIVTRDEVEHLLKYGGSRIRR